MNFNKTGFYLSIITALLTIITFGIAINTPPISGAFCVEDCIEYPFLDIANRFPGDYIWMFPALLLNISFFILFAFLHHHSKFKGLLSFLAMSFAFATMLILNIDYFLQLTVIQPAILRNEPCGMAILTQYNPHGIFIALEEIGYLMMSISFLFMGLATKKETRFGVHIKWMLIGSFILALASLFWTRGVYGFDTGYLYEIMIISIDWLVLLSYCILLGLSFNKEKYDLG